VAEYAVELHRVSTYYYGERAPAIIDVSLKIPRGSLTLITGPNGAGKTTLLETILGLLTSVRGVIRVLGHEVPRESSRVRKLCSYLPQDFMKPPTEPFTAREVVAMGLASKRFVGRLSQSDWRLVDRALDLLGVLDCADKTFGKLSGGQQQRVLLARALVRDAELVLLDEPFSAIDRATKAQIVGEVFPELLRRGRTIIMVSHHSDPLPLNPDVLVEMRDGRIARVVQRHVKPPD